MKASSLLRTSFLATVLASRIVYAAPTIAGGNGSFETTTAPADQALNWWQWGLEDFTINGWTVTKADGVTAFTASENAPWFCNNVNGNGTASDGNFFVNVEGGVKWRLKTSLEGLVAGTSYTVSFATRSRGGSGNFAVTVDTTEPAGRTSLAPTSTSTWTTQSFTFVAEAESHVLTISNQNTAGVGFYVDNFSIIETPPPAWTAADGIWVGGDGNWNTPENWQDSLIAQGIDRSATFNGFTPVTVNVDVERPIAALIFSGADHTLAAGIGSLTLDAGAQLITPTIQVEDGFTSTVAATLNGAEGLQKTGNGTLVLSGTKNYEGTTQITAGTLKYLNSGFGSAIHTIASGAVLEFDSAGGTLSGSNTTINGSGTLRKTGAGTLVWPATVGTFALGSGALIDVQQGTFTAGSFGNENWTANLSDLNVAEGATFNTVEANVRLNRITGSGTLASGWTGAGYQNLTIGVDNGSSTFNGTIANGSATANLVKAGTGTITLAGINTYTGNTTISGGALELAAGGLMTFVVTDTPSSNKITGTGTATLNGDFNINTAAVSGSTGRTWLLVERSTLSSVTFGSTFSVIGFHDGDQDGIWTMTDTKGNWSFNQATGELRFDVVNDYLSWQSATGVTGTQSQDDDGDGLNNFQEYAFGLNPLAASSVNPMVTPLNANGQFSYSRRSLAKSNLTYTVRSSTTLAANDWTNLVKDTDYTESVVTNGDVETVTITLTPLPTAAKFFIQVKVDAP